MLQIRDVQKRFADSQEPVLAATNLEIQQGEFFSLLGPSGCGKTTLLRIVAGLEMPDGGEVLWSQESWNTMPVQQRPCHMVFQRHALFPHLTVAENVEFGLRMKKVEVQERQTRVREALQMVGLESLFHRKPDQLSGGQSQRVALARALVNRPQLVLLDEPLSALDAQLRLQMQQELRSLQRNLGLTFLYVTHDQDEAFALSDRVGVMSKGQLLQVGTPEELYFQPCSLFVAEFLGDGLVLRGLEPVRSSDPSGLGRWRSTSLETELAGVRVTDLKMTEHTPYSAHALGGTSGAVAVVRPGWLSLTQDLAAPTPGQNQVTLRVLEQRFQGAEIILIMETLGADARKVRVPLTPQQTQGRGFAPGELLQLRFPAQQTRVFTP